MNKSFIKWIVAGLGIIFFAIQGLLSNSGSENFVWAYISVALFIVSFIMYRKESDDKARAEGRPTRAEIKHEEKMLKLERDAAKAKIKASKESAKEAKGGGIINRLAEYNSELIRCPSCSGLTHPTNMLMAKGSMVCERCAKKVFNNTL